MQKIIITGGAGYIGSHTAVALQQAGFQVVVIDNLSNSKIDVVDKIKKITGLDLREFDHAIIFKVALMVKKYLAANPVKY